jgi:hypothetical protein
MLASQSIHERNITTRMMWIPQAHKTEDIQVIADRQPTRLEDAATSSFVQPIEINSVGSARIVQESVHTTRTRWIDNTRI